MLFTLELKKKPQMHSRINLKYVVELCNKDHNILQGKIKENLSK